MYMGTIIHYIDTNLSNLGELYKYINHPNLGIMPSLSAEI
jgi:hypothetical protein